MSVLVCQNVTLRRGDRQIIDQVSLSVARGEVVALMGASGAGKSTLLRAVAGLDPIHDGSIAIGGVTLTKGAVPRGRAAAELYAHVGMVFQFHHLFEHLSALDNVCLALTHVRGTPQDDARSRAEALLATLDVAHRASAFPSELSGGEAQRVAIARALALDPPLLVMDEPTASLDSERRGELATALRALARDGRTLLMATHDLEFVRQAADRAVVLEQGRIVRDMSASRLGQPDS